MKKLILIILVFLFLPAYATTWVQIGDNEYIDKDNIKFYVNDDGNIDFTKKYFWIKDYNRGNYFKKSEKSYGKKIGYIKYQQIIDFNKKSFAMKSWVVYDEDGNAIDSYTIRDNNLDWDPVVPETVGELRYELVTHPRMLKKLYKTQQNYSE